LSVLKDGENTDGETYTRGNRGLRSRFKIEGKVRQAFVRTKKGESILEDEQYLNPLIRFFRAAVDAWGRHQITGDDVMGGCRGLENLRSTYASDQTRRAKINSIIEAVRRELRGIRVEGVFVAPGERNLILGDQNFPAMRRRILDIISEGENNAGLRDEYTEGVSKEFLEEVFGKSAPQKPTVMPVGNLVYQRASMGVCVQYHLDGHVRTGVKLVGERISCNAEGISKLFRFVGRDEGLMFAVSQMACQAGVPCLPTTIIEMGGRDGNAQVPLILIGGDRVVPTFGTGGANITKLGNQILVSSQFQWQGNDVAYARNGMVMGDIKTLAEFGITSMLIRFTISLVRSGSRIDMQIHESLLRIVTD